MSSKILEALRAISQKFGDGVFYNLTTTRNLLRDLAPQLTRERVQVMHFLDIGGYFQLKHAGEHYPQVRAKLVAQLVDTYSIDASVASWTLDIFSRLLGYSFGPDGVVYAPEGEMRDTSPAATHRPSVPMAPRQRKKPRLRPVMTISESVRTKSANVTNFDTSCRISADAHSVAVLKGGQVRAAGPNSDGQCNTRTYDWRDIVAVSAGAHFTVGLRADGTVVGIGRNDFGQRSFGGLRGVAQISAGARHTALLLGGGRAIAVGQNKNGECDISHWRDLRRVVAGKNCTFGIKTDGRCIFAGNNADGSLSCSHLRGVVDIAYGASDRIVALTQKGTILPVGRENKMKVSFSHLSGIVQVSAAPDYIAGLFDDGTVKILAHFQKPEMGAALEEWRDIAAIAAGRYHILGLTSQDTLISAFLHPDRQLDMGQTNVGVWEIGV